MGQRNPQGEINALRCLKGGVRFGEESSSSLLFLVPARSKGRTKRDESRISLKAHKDGGNV